MPARILPWLQRALLLGGQAALLLPFLVVQDCTTGEVQAFTGLEAYGSSRDLLVLAVVQAVAALVLALLAWRGGRDAAHTAAGLGLRGTVAAVFAGTALVAPPYAFLFDGVRPLVGWVLHAGSWLVLCLAWLVGAGHGAWRLRGLPVARAEAAAVVLVLAAPLALALAMLAGGDKDALFAGLAGGVAGLPLALAGLGVGRLVAAAAPDRRRWRAAFWAFTAAWLLFWAATAL